MLVAKAIAKISQSFPSVCFVHSHNLKGSLQWKNDLGLYFTLVLVMKIGMCDLMIFCLV